MNRFVNAGLELGKSGVLTINPRCLSDKSHSNRKKKLTKTPALRLWTITWGSLVIAAPTPLNFELQLISSSYLWFGRHIKARAEDIDTRRRTSLDWFHFITSSDPARKSRKCARLAGQETRVRKVQKIKFSASCTSGISDFPITRKRTSKQKRNKKKTNKQTKIRLTWAFTGEWDMAVTGLETDGGAYWLNGELREESDGGLGGAEDWGGNLGW